MSQSYQNLASDQICKVQNDKKLISFHVLWSSFFVTLVAKKYRLATMLPFVPRMVCDSR